MVHTLLTPPVVGTNIQLGLSFAPGATTVWCLLNFGSCVAGGPLLPPLCGPLYVPLGASLTSPPPTVTVGASCTATAVIIQPVPPWPALIGTPLASQFVGVCPPSGTTMSNCLSWVLQ
jgi:hypothetical protein